MVGRTQVPVSYLSIHSAHLHSLIFFWWSPQPYTSLQGRNICAQNCTIVFTICSLPESGTTYYTLLPLSRTQIYKASNFMLRQNDQSANSYVDNILRVKSRVGKPGTRAVDTAKRVNFIFQLFSLKGSRTSPNCCSKGPTTSELVWTVPQTMITRKPWGSDNPFTPVGSRFGLKTSCCSLVRLDSRLQTASAWLISSFWRMSLSKKSSDRLASWKKCCGPNRSAGELWLRYIGLQAFNIW